MKKLIVVVLVLVVSGLMTAQDKKAQPATPPKESGEQKATPSPNAVKGQEMKKKNEEKRDAKKEAIAEKKEVKRDAKEAKKEAKSAMKAAKKAAKAERKDKH